jgi:hypothetical protein
MKTKPSFTALIGGLCLCSILVNTLLLSFLAIVNHRASAYKQAEAYALEQVVHIQDQLIDRFRHWGALMSYAASASAPFMSVEAPDTPHLQSLFQSFMDAESDFWLFYGCSNLVWNQPGGYMVYNDGHSPRADYDNTQRSWFIGAKQTPGEVAYAAPYILL